MAVPAAAAAAASELPTVPGIGVPVPESGVALPEAVVFCSREERERKYESNYIKHTINQTFQLTLDQFGSLTAALFGSCTNYGGCVSCCW